ncbi:MAG: M23 family metallopeptidase [Pacificimonas sp.]
MRTLGTILATAIITALLTSAAWVFLYNKEDRRTPQVVTPAPSASSEPSGQRDVAAEDINDDMVFTPAAEDVDLMAQQLVVPVADYDISRLVAPPEDAARKTLFFEAEAGTPVRAIDDGVLVKFRETPREGIQIYQYDPTESWVYVYAHLDARAEDIEEGGAVRRGQVLGIVGNSGVVGPNGPHVALDVNRLGRDKNWWRGAPVNPYPAFVAE